jgi:hypothetical protein
MQFKDMIGVSLSADVMENAKGHILGNWCVPPSATI